MVSIGNFRNQQLYLGANRNLSTAKATLQVNTGAAKFRPSGKTTFIKIDNINSQPAQCKNDDKDTIDPSKVRPLSDPLSNEEFYALLEGTDEVGGAVLRAREEVPGPPTKIEQNTQKEPPKLPKKSAQ